MEPLLCVGVVWQSSHLSSPGAPVKPAGGPLKFARTFGFAELSVNRTRPMAVIKRTKTAMSFGSTFSKRLSFTARALRHAGGKTQQPDELIAGLHISCSDFADPIFLFAHTVTS